jgi:hypothetical protein
MGNSELFTMAAPHAAELHGAASPCWPPRCSAGPCSGRERPQLPGPGRAAAGAHLGQHAGLEPPVYRPGRVARHLPGLCISLTLLGINLLGDAVRDRSIRACEARAMSHGRHRTFRCHRGCGKAFRWRWRASGRRVVDRRVLRHPARRAGRHRRRVGQRQDPGGARPHGLTRRASGCAAAAFCSRAKTCMRWPPARLRALRGARVGMVFQEPMTSLNPRCASAAAGEGWRCTASFRAARRADPRHAGSGSASSDVEHALAPIRTSSPAACASGSCWPR